MSALDDFNKFHNSNSGVYAEFAKIARREIRNGKVSLKHHDIINEIRRNKKIRTTTMRSGGPKIDNNHVAFYARLFMKLNPNYKGIFKVRRMKVASSYISNIGKDRNVIARDSDHY